MPVLHQPPRRDRAHLPAGERVPALSPAGIFAGVGEQEALLQLSTGELEVRGRLVDASNATLYAVVRSPGLPDLACVYKPVAGERPLWDFPDDTLGRREVAAYVVSAATGWDVVPPTVFRDGPLGEGSVQLWLTEGDDDPGSDDPDDEETEDRHDDLDDDLDDDVEEDPEEVVLPTAGAGLIDIVAPRRVAEGWLTVLHAEDGRGRPVVLAHADDPRLRRIALLDAVLNNADRKGGHVLPGTRGGVHGVDHGLTFHVEPKLRTVLWGWAGARLHTEERDVLTRLAEDLTADLGEQLALLLSVEEVVATLERVQRLLDTDRLPRPRNGNPLPWPPF